MSYYGISMENAKNILSEREKRQDDDNEFVKQFVVEKTGGDFEAATAVDARNLILDIATEFDGKGQKWAADFDSACAPAIHKKLGLSPRVAGDPDFWRWFTFADDGSGAVIVEWRYGKRGQPGSASEWYYGIGSLKKGMLAKLWICANMMYVERAERPYDGIEVSDVDLWDSHIIDVDFASIPQMARAFVKVVRDFNIERGNVSKPDMPTGYRDLAKELRRRYTTTAFELLDENELYQFVTEVWKNRQTWNEEV